MSSITLCTSCTNPSLCSEYGCRIAPAVPTGLVPKVYKKDANGTPRTDEPQDLDPIGLAGLPRVGAPSPDSGDERDKSDERPSPSRYNPGRVHEIESVVTSGPYEEGKGGFYRVVITHKIPKAQFLGALERLVGKPGASQ